MAACLTGDKRLTVGLAEVSHLRLIGRMKTIGTARVSAELRNWYLCNVTMQLSHYTIFFGTVMSQIYCSFIKNLIRRILLI